MVARFSPPWTVERLKIPIFTLTILIGGRTITMRTKLLVVLVLLLLAMADVSHAGGRCGRWGGGWRRLARWLGRRLAAGLADGGWYGPGWGGWGWGPSFGVSFVAPVPVYRTVYVAQPRRVYATSAYGTYSAPALYPCPNTPGEARLLSRTHRRRLRSDDQPGHSRLSGRLRFADNRTPRPAHPRQPGSLRSKWWQQSPRALRGDLPAQQRCLALRASVFKIRRIGLCRCRIVPIHRLVEA